MMFCACVQWIDHGLAIGKRTQAWLVVQQLVDHATSKNSNKCSHNYERYQMTSKNYQFVLYGYGLHMIFFSF